MRNFFLPLITLFFFSCTVEAEEGCPAGQIPSRAGNNMTSCGPIPAGYYQQQAPARPSGKWIKTWGAIAMGSINSTTSYGVTTGKISKAEAEDDALRRCASHGETNCSIAISYENQCAVIAEPQISGKPLSSGFVRFTGAETIEKASKIALKKCKNENKDSPSAACKIVYKNCTEQTFQKFD